MVVLTWYFWPLIQQCHSSLKWLHLTIVCIPLSFLLLPSTTHSIYRPQGCMPVSQKVTLLLRHFHMRVVLLLQLGQSQVHCWSLTMTPSLIKTASWTLIWSLSLWKTRRSPPFTIVHQRSNMIPVRVAHQKEVWNAFSKENKRWAILLVAGGDCDFTD